MGLLPRWLVASACMALVLHAAANPSQDGFHDIPDGLRTSAEYMSKVTADNGGAAGDRNTIAYTHRTQEQGLGWDNAGARNADGLMRRDGRYDRTGEDERTQGYRSWRDSTDEDQNQQAHKELSYGRPDMYGRFAGADNGARLQYNARNTDVPRTWRGDNVRTRAAYGQEVPMRDNIVYQQKTVYQQQSAGAWQSADLRRARDVPGRDYNGFRANNGQSLSGWTTDRPRQTDRVVYGPIKYLDNTKNTQAMSNRRGSDGYRGPNWQADRVGRNDGSYDGQFRPRDNNQQIQSAYSHHPRRDEIRPVSGAQDQSHRSQIIANDAGWAGRDHSQYVYSQSAQSGSFRGANDRNNAGQQGWERFGRDAAKSGGEGEGEEYEILYKWDQCGGLSVPGDLKADPSPDPYEGYECEKGTYCKFVDKWYSQCVPGEENGGGGGGYYEGTIYEWGQCGGLTVPYDLKVDPTSGPYPGYECEDGTYCKYFSDWYSQCVPGDVPGGDSDYYTIYKWGQCGGLNVPYDIKAEPTTGPYYGYQCETGTYCKYSNDWYSQCVPGKNDSTTPKPETPTTPEEPTPTPPEEPTGGDCYTVQVWQQCGGLTVPKHLKDVKPYDGPYPGYCCENGTSCEYSNSWYYQCRPKSEYTPTNTTEPPVKPTEPPVKPTDPPVKPTEPPVKPTDPPVKPTEPPVKPTDPPVKPTEPPVKPTEPPVKPTEPPVKPTDPPVKPTEPEGKPPGQPPTKPPKPVGPCANVLALYDQCGGKNAPVGIEPKPGLWDGYCCENGTVCKDQNHWYSQCL